MLCAANKIEVDVAPDTPKTRSQGSGERPRATSSSPPPAATRTAAQAAELALDEQTARSLRSHLPEVAESVIAAIIEEVPSYSAPFQGRMGRVIEQAVRTSLDSFLDAASGAREGEQTSIGVGVQAAEQLGRAEARAGRPVDALLSAYRVGARVSWREVSRMAVAQGAEAATLGRFAEVVFTYIDELSAASVAGHNAETHTAERARIVNLDRLVRSLLVGAPETRLVEAAQLARWTPARTLTVVLVAGERALNTAAMLDPRTLTLGEDLPPVRGLPAPDRVAALLVPDAGGRARGALLDLLSGRDAVVGPAVPWTEADRSYARAVRAAVLPREDGTVLDTDAHLAQIVLAADPETLADLRESALAPFADLTEGSAERLAETLRAWLLLQGRRELVAEALHVHPQTVRYRMGQVRELLGDRLQDPDAVLELVLALSARPS
ncbi:PucR family transcriptional regulator [Janibacter melonis]|uniref:PucR family transcriptional regulator n=1 Tax=Janibacter melonis TaxID=262209 RepID=UPI001786B05F|nr:PucR family transcriptional regulator [Janibacter melonis]